MNTQTKSEAAGLELSNLTFQKHSAWGNEKARVTATANLSRKGQDYGAGTKNISIEMPPEAAAEILRLLAPVVVKFAADAADALATQAKQLAADVGDSMLRLAETTA